ncbi:major facilitator superfamily domain-containing protein [Infundibulicybe gibba]|nr:major facilitator superfamily domain-containing protein [Infundibulicybe gibba]
MDNANLPALISWPRITTLIASVFVTISSGTNYVAYAPQLGSRLHITHTQLNIVALAGNVGVYSSGPVWGRIVDTRGPRLLLALSFIFLFSGYSGIRYLFNSGLPDSNANTTLSTFRFCILVACSYLTGAGGNGGLTSSVNSTAKTFPDRARATTTGIVISGFGLSAFFFSTIAHVVYPGDTSSFSCSLPETHNLERGADSHGSRPSSVLVHRDDSRANEDDVQDFAYSRDLQTNSLELSPTRSTSPEARAIDGLPNIYGWDLWKSGDFWLLLASFQYINNVGSMSQALFAKDNPTYDEIQAAKWQAAQVSTISLMNFSGRIFIGLVSDFAKNRLGLPRSYSLLIVASFCFISQITAANVDDVRHLWMASALLGLGYGGVFSLFPIVCVEWFGLPHFSENWGYLSLSPMVAGNLFSLAFGRNLDAHENATPSPQAVSPPQCLQGRECYVDSLHLTIAAIWAGWRDRRKIALSMVNPKPTRRSEVIWQDNS